MGYEKIGWMNEPVYDGVHSGWKGGRMVETSTCRPFRTPLRKYPSLALHVDPQDRVAEGHTFTSDLCLLQLLVEASLRLRVLVLRAYKPSVPGALEDVTAWHLAETLLQAYYMRRKHS